MKYILLLLLPLCSLTAHPVVASPAEDSLLKALVDGSDVIVVGSFDESPVAEIEDDGSAIYFVYLKPLSILKGEGFFESKDKELIQIIYKTRINVRQRDIPSFLRRSDASGIWFAKIVGNKLVSVDPWFAYIAFNTELVGEIKRLSPVENDDHKPSIEPHPSPLPPSKDPFTTDSSDRN